MTAKKTKKPRGPSDANPKPLDAAAEARPETNPKKTAANDVRPKRPSQPPPAFVGDPIIGASLGHLDKPGPYPRNTRWLVLGAIALAWILGFGMRALWLSNAVTVPGSSFEDKRLLTTADAYFYASGVKFEVDGSIAGNARVPTNGDNILVAITSTVVNVLDVPIETACQWMPAFIAPLVAIPLVLLGLMLGNLMWGFLASLVSVLGFSYWNRTVPGYFDTDMVTILFIMGVMTLVMAGFWRRRPLFGTLAAMLLVAAPYMHPGSERVLAALSLGAFGYSIVFERREPHAYRIVLALLIAFLPIPFWLRLILIGGLELAFSRVRVPLWSLISLAGVVLAIACWKGRSMDLVLNMIGIRFGGGGGGGFDPGVNFPGIGETVAELSNPTIGKLGERVAGHSLLVVTGALGYLAAAWRFRPLLLLAPLLALGTVLAVGGQRFTIFAVPIVALGNVWLMLMIGRIVARSFPRRPKTTELAVAALLSPLAIGPAVAHGLDYPPRTALSTPEAAQLTALSKRVNPGDFMISWWDYAYGAWYHAGVSTIVDGTKQNEDLWIATEVLFTPSQREAAGLSRLAVEQQVKQRPLDPVIGKLLENWTTTSGRPVSDFVPALREGRVPLPTPTRQVFFYIPWRIVQIVPNVAKIRPAAGLVPDDELKLSAFLVVNQVRADGTHVTRTGWAYDDANKVLVGPRRERVKVYKISDVFTDGSGRVRSRDTDVLPDGKVCIVNIKHSNMVLYMDRAIYDSVLSQLLFLVRPDPTLFEAVSYTQGGVVYRILP